MVFGSSNMSDDEFLKYVPSKTKSFILECTRYLSAIEANKSVSVHPGTSREYEYILMASIYALMNYDSKYIELFRKCKLKTNIDIKKANDISKKAISSFRINESNLCDNLILTPLEITSTLISVIGSQKLLEPYAYDYFDYDKLEKRTKHLVELERLELVYDIKKIYYKNMSSETINYLEKSARIFSALYKDSDIKIIDYTLEDIKSLSLFLGLNDIDNNDYSILIKQQFKNINFTEMYNTLNITPSYYTSITPILVLKNFFNEYSNTGTNISSIFKKKFITDENTPIKKIFSKMGIDYNIMNELLDLLSGVDTRKLLLDRKGFNSRLTPEIINYFENSYRLYKYIMKDGSSKLIDGTIIQCEKDIRILSMVLEMLNRDCDLHKFFDMNNITKEYICNLLKIDLNTIKTDDIEIIDNDLVLNFYIYLTHIKTRIDFDDKNSIELFAKYSDITLNDIEDIFTKFSIIDTRIINRIYNDITKNILPDAWSEVMKVQLKRAKIQSDNEIIEDFFSELDPSIYKYLSKVSIIFNNIKDIIKCDGDSQVVALLLGTKSLNWYEDGLIYEYIKSLGFDEEKVKRFFGLSDNIYTGEVSPLVIKNNFHKYVFGSNDIFPEEKDKINIQWIVRNSLRKSMYYSFRINNLLDSMGMNYNSFDNFKMDYYYYSEKRKREESENAIGKINKEGLLLYFKDAYYFYNNLMHADAFSDSLLYLENNEDYKYLSILLSILCRNTIYSNIFYEYGITNKYIKDKIQCTENIEMVPNDIDYDSIRNVTLYQTYRRFIKYFNGATTLCNSERIDRFHGEKKNAGFIARRLFDKNLENNNIIKKIVGQENYEYIKERLYSDELKDNVFTFEEVKKQLLDQTKLLQNKKLDCIDEIMDFMLEGDSGLSKYSEYILSQVKEISDALNLDKSLENMDELADKIYTDIPNKQGLLAKIFSSKDVKRELNSDILSDLSKELNTHIDTLAVQIKKYREIFEIISLYLNTVREYQYFFSKILCQLNTEYDSIMDCPETYSKRLNYSQAIEGIKDKISAYERTIALMSTQQFQVYQTIINHLITRNALQTSRDDIIPIISSEVLFSISNISSRNALELSNSLVGLFKNVIGQDVSGVKANLKVLKSSNLPMDTVNKIVDDFDSFVDEINSSREDILKLSVDNNTDMDVKVKKLGKKENK